LNGGNGTVFRLTGKVLTTLWSFSGGSDGALPSGALITDWKGALYGTTEGGGAFNGPVCDGFGCGTVFAIGNAAGSLTTIWTFSGDDGALPGGTLLTDATGVLFGTTQGGGANGNGTVFKLTPPAADQTAWTPTALWSFSGGSDGAIPGLGALIADQSGTLYGTTEFGGATGCFGGFGCGVVFKLTPPAAGRTVWTLSTLYRFSGGSDGRLPIAGLIADRKGALYGTTSEGGIPDHGVVFKLTPPASGPPPWNETVLLSFLGNDGDFPNAGLIADESGALYGTTQFGGGSNNGVAFKLTGTGFVP
jgi:uncharacterized repeat protein (TIGR03803 family)